MSVIKGKPDYRIILDISNGKYSKNQIKKTLRSIEVFNLQVIQGTNSFTFIQNIIKIGMYTIRLWLPGDAPPEWNRLKNFGDFQISIYENLDKKELDIKKDWRFKNQYWSNKNFYGKLRIKHLIDIIIHCYKLNSLRSFL